MLLLQGKSGIKAINYSCFIKLLLVLSSSLILHFTTFLVVTVSDLSVNNNFLCIFVNCLLNSASVGFFSLSPTARVLSNDAAVAMLH